MTLARQWVGDAPFQETWFIEVLFSADRGLWVRYVLDATRGVAEVWALVVERSGVVASHVEELPLADVRGPLFTAPCATLARDRARGEVGGIAWDLRLDDLGVRHRHVPRLRPALGLGRTYHPGILDLRVQGHVTFGGETWQVSRGMGVLGHLWGRHSRVHRWSWAHCNAFHEDGILFEGLAADVGCLTLTSLVLHVQGHTYGFSRPRDLARTWSHTSDGLWSFQAERDGATLVGEVRLKPGSAATVRYDRADQDPLFCTNTRFADARIVLRDPRRRVDVDLRSREAAFEVVGTEALAPACLPARDPR
ncbi:MAG: hypothetical protein KC656_05385 [Myxococcales bacterium]|nr:hypothetical protein [Myxococcales bacterium]